MNVTMMRPVRFASLACAALLWSPTVAAAQGGVPYTLDQIVALVEGDWSGTDILALVRDECISFRVTQPAESRLRSAGAGEALVTGLRDVCYRGAPAARTAPAAPSGQGVVLIEGYLPPGWARIVNELPPNTNRTITLTPGRPAVIVVGAPGWCPDRIDLTLGAGDERRWTPSLRARPWVGDC
jgi:hypothetical protein